MIIPRVSSPPPTVSAIHKSNKRPIVSTSKSIIPNQPCHHPPTHSTSRQLKNLMLGREKPVAPKCKLSSNQKPRSISLKSSHPIS